MKKTSIFLALLATTTLFSSSSIKSIDIFTNKIFINQKVDSNKKSVELFGNVDIQDIKFILDDKCKVNSFDTQTQRFSDDKLTKEIDKLNKQININKNQIKAFNSNIAFLEKSSLSGLSELNKLKKASNFVKDEVLDNYNKIYEIEEQIKTLNEQLEKLQNKRVSETYTRLNYDISCNSEVLVTYPANNIQRRNFYDIYYDSKTDKLELKNLLFIKQSFGKDLKAIDINLYTYNYISQLKPNIFIPEYLDIKEKQEAKVYAKSMNDLSPVILKSSNMLNAESYRYVEDTTKSFFQASNVELLSGKETKIEFANDVYKTENVLEIDGYSMSQPFYKVTFKSDKLYGVLNANLYLDGTYVGKTRLNEIKKDKENSIYFGTDRFVDIDKKLIKDMKEKPFFSIDRLKSEKIWDYTITNKGSVTQKFVLLEKVPVSKHKDIKVKLVGKTKESKVENNGKISFEFTLKPKESKTINFGYEIDKPTN